MNLENIYWCESETKYINMNLENIIDVNLKNDSSWFVKAPFLILISLIWCNE